MKDNPLLIKSFRFAVEIIGLYKYLTQVKKEFILSKQLLKSGTSIGANAEEAIGGISKRDFRAKIGICYKEARECKYWLRLLKETEYISDKQFNHAIEKCEELCKISYKIIQSSS